MVEHVGEVERKFLSVPGFIPDLGDAGEVGGAVVHELVATYYDTLFHDLTRAGWSLRRRTGGDDDGWHLKRPRHAPAARLEFRTGLGRDDIIPGVLREEAAEVVDGHALVPVARLETHRVQSLIRVDGAPAASLCVDRVTARVGVNEESWDEIEIELLPGTDPDLLDDLSAALVASGASPAPYGSKVARALAEADVLVAPDSPQAPSGDVLLTYLSRQVGTLQAWEPAVRVDAPDAVHKARVACRRLRGVLQTFSPLFERGRAAGLRADLRWAGGLLGAPRDAEVLREGFTEVFAGSVEPAVAPSVRDRILTHLDAEHAVHHAALVTALDGARWRALRAGLVALLVDPPFTALAREAAGVRLAARADRAVARVRNLRDQAAADPGELSLWHEVRKQAKAVRYSFDALGQAFGEAAALRAEAWSLVTDELGTLQDSIVSRTLLDELEREDAVGGEHASWTGLRAAEQRRGAQALAAGRAHVDAALALGPLVSGKRRRG